MTSVDVFWLRDKSVTDLDNLPEPDVLAEEIIEILRPTSTASGRYWPGWGARNTDVSDDGQEEGD